MLSDPGDCAKEDPKPQTYNHFLADSPARQIMQLNAEILWFLQVHSWLLVIRLCRSKPLY